MDSSEGNPNPNLDSNANPIIKSLKVNGLIIRLNRGLICLATPRHTGASIQDGVGAWVRCTRVLRLMYS
jgi:hypothetical protein